MPCYRGTHFIQGFTLRNKESGEPIDVSTWELRCHLRDSRNDPELLLELNTANGGFIPIPDSPGRLQMSITPEQTMELPLGTLSFDVLVTNVPNPPKMLFEGKFRVRNPVTRDG